MGTRSIIARTNGDGFVGRYCHWDGYPSGVGAELYKQYNTYFAQDAEKMMSFLVDQHPAGWSIICGADFSIQPGFVEDPSQWEAKESQPKCYCHGDRHEGEQIFTSQDNTGCAWAYAINEKTSHMFVHRHAGHHNDKDLWELVSVVDLNGPEPDWGAMEQQGYRQEED